jgi:DNA primase
LKEDRFEKQIVSMMLQFPEMIQEVKDRNMIDLFDNEVLKEIGRVVLDYEDRGDLAASDIILHFDDDTKRNLVAALSVPPLGNGEGLWNRDGCLKLLSMFEAKRQRTRKLRILKEIKAAEKNRNFELSDELLKKKCVQDKKLF